MAVKRHRTVQAVVGTIRRHGLLPEGSVRVVVGLSGGPDSVALAAILRELAGGRRYRAELVLAHLNHGLRPSARRDEAFVRQLADAWTSPLVVRSVAVPQEAEAGGIGIEEAARRARYAFLDEVAREAGAPIVAVGHHRDDQAETVLMNVLRGSAIRGLAGMPIRRPIAPGSPVALIRPLLEVSRADILSYLDARRLAFVDDETNRSPEMFRNRLRHELLPLVERDYVPGLSHRLVQLAGHARVVQDDLSARAAAAWDGAVTSATARAVEFSLDALRECGRAVCGELVLAAMERLGAGRRGICADHVVSACDIIDAPRGGQHLDLPGGVHLVRRGRRVRIVRR
jgi:tRNA(Ile)-lysidine synthase